MPDSFGFNNEDCPFEPMSWQWVTEQLQTARKY